MRKEKIELEGLGMFIYLAIKTETTAITFKNVQVLKYNRKWRKSSSGVRRGGGLQGEAPPPHNIRALSHEVISHMNNF